MSAQEPQATPLWRLITARVLVVLGVIVTAIAIIAGYLRWQAFDDGTFRNTAGELIANEEVQQQVAASMVDQLYANVDVATELQTELPPNLQRLAGPISAGLRELANRVALEILQRPRFQAIWLEAVSVSHDRLVAVLKDEARVVEVQGNAIFLDLRPLVAELGSRLGMTNLESRLPEDAGLIRVMEADQLENAQDATALFEAVATWLFLVPLALWAIAIWLARGRRRKELRAIAIGLVVAGLLVLVLRRIGGRYVVDSLATTTSAEDVTQTVWDIVTDLMKDGAWSVILLGLVALLGVWLSGPTRSGTAARGWLAPALARPGIAFGAAAAFLLLIVWWGPTAQTRRWLFLLVAAILLAVGVEALRRVTAREFPEASEIEPAEMFRRPLGRLRGG